MKENRKFKLFDEAVEEEKKTTGSLKVAYYKVSEQIESKVGFKPYTSLQSYKNARSRNRKRN